MHRPADVEPGGSRSGEPRDDLLASRREHHELDDVSQGREARELSRDRVLSGRWLLVRHHARLRADGGERCTPIHCADRLQGGSDRPPITFYDLAALARRSLEKVLLADEARDE